MADYRTIKDLNGKAIVSASTGQKIGTVSGVMLDPGGLTIAALTTSKGNVLKPETETIAADKVQVWGKDVILVTNGDVVQRELEPAGHEQWVDAQDYVKGRSAVSLDGRRLGTVADILIDAGGQIVGFDLQEVNEKETALPSRFIPVEAVHSLGKDVLIVDVAHMEQGPSEERASDQNRERRDTRPL